LTDIFSDGKTCMPSSVSSMKKDFPEVEYAVASRNEGTGIVSYGDSTVSRAGSSGKHARARMQLVSEDFFRVFSYRVLEGDKHNAFSNPSGAMISDKLALQLFNTTKGVIGRRIEWGGEGPKGSYTVAGVFEAPPANATDQFDLLLPYLLYMTKEAEDVANWGSNGVVTYLLLKEGTGLRQFNAKIKDYASSRVKWEGDLFLQKYSDRYLYNRYENGIQVGGRIEYVRLFSIIAIFILIIACINFMNLSTARASGRMKEVGVRKVIGARRVSLVLQFMGESLLMAFLSLLLAMLLVSLFLPVFRGITGKELHLVVDSRLLLTAGCLTLVTGLIAGSYPALYLSGFRPVAVLKGKISSSVGETLVRKGLVVFQFTVSVSLIITVLIVYRQMNLIQTTNLGYNRDQVLHFSTEGKLPGREDAFLADIRNIPGVVGGDELAAPSIIVERRHRRLVENLVLLAAPFHRRSQHLMPVAKNIRFDDARLAHDPFRRITSAVNRRRHVFNRDVIQSRLGRDDPRISSCLIRSHRRSVSPWMSHCLSARGRSPFSIKQS